MSRRILDRLAAALFAIALPIVASGQTPVHPASGFGTDDLHVVNVPFHAFLPQASSHSYNSACCFTDGTRWASGGHNFLLASVDAGLVPNGARIEEVRFYVQDTNAGTDMDFRGFLCRNWIDSTGQNPGASVCPAVVTSSGSPGDTVLTDSLATTLRYQFDVGSNGTLDAVSWVLFAQFGINGQTAYDGSVRLRSVEILFRRQIAPAPVSATFNDVGPADFGFQQIEALVASGITAGCGGGNFCPAATLTRAQMAVFVAKALGLHWPALF